ncbi:MAG: hypothetical protein P8K80_06195 [Phycisphaerales bacterium]|nr:hypothetical protein [Phycisphaerales bacterium]
MRTSRGIHGLIVMMVLLLAVVPATAEEFGEPVWWPEPTELTIEECQEWASYYWEWYETGIIPPGADRFEFSEPVGSGMNPLQFSLVVFEDLYADHLTDDYEIWEFIMDEPAIYEAFKHHSITGELDAPYVLVIGNDSKGKKKKPGLSPGLVPVDSCSSITDPILRALCERLHRGVGDSRLPYSPCYQEDGSWPWSRPGFDCDDYADAMRWWLQYYLRGEFPDVEIGKLSLYYGRSGHVVNYIYLNGAYWLVDAQTGEVRGPYGSMAELKAGAWQLMRDLYWAPDYDPWLKRTWGWPIMEPSPWYTDPERRQEIIDRLRLVDPTRYWPPDFQP